MIEWNKTLYPENKDLFDKRASDILALNLDSVLKINLKRLNDPMTGTALMLTIDEGFACYFTWRFFHKKITKYEAVENMSEKNWNWYLDNEKRIFSTLHPYFEDYSGDNPLLRNDNFKLFPNAPKTLYYWLGFRIVESYIHKNGENSWRDLYEMNVQDVLDKSGYENHINGL